MVTTKSHEMTLELRGSSRDEDDENEHSHTHHTRRRRTNRRHDTGHEGRMTIKNKARTRKTTHEDLHTNATLGGPSCRYRVAIVLVLRNEMVLELVCGANGVFSPFRPSPLPLGRVRLGPLPPFTPQPVLNDV